MSKLEAFFAQNAETIEEVSFIASSRFKDPETNEPIPFIIKPLTEKEVSDIRKKCIKRVKNNNGTYSDETDNDAVGIKMCVEAITFPNLKDAALQDSYQVKGADNLLTKMLYSGEYKDLAIEVLRVSGYDKDMNELVEEAKN